MLAQESQLLFLIVFFIYGLAFFTMGIALLLETSHSPSLTEASLLLPLAIFGILHGLHEWFELFLEQTSWMGTQVAETITAIRLFFLAISFISLALYGFQASQLQRKETLVKLALPLVILGVYFAIIIISTIIAQNNSNLNPFILVNNLIRYLLAVPAAVLASIGLRVQAKEAKEAKRFSLAFNLNCASFGFGIYGFSQLFVSPLAMFPAQLINNQTFFATTGVPSEVIRSAMALLITFGMVRATHTVEIERQEQFSVEREARINALERVKEEMAAREEMRRDLLRHTVQAQEDERARISRELHDETAQVLSAFSLGLATLSNKLDKEHGDLISTIDHLQNLGKDMSQGIYRLVHDLRPAQLDDLGLVPAIQNLIGRECCKMDLDVSLSVEGTSKRVEPLIETVLFRAAQAALVNVARHAQIQRANVIIRFTEDQVILSVKDKGIGFNPKGPFIPPSGWGLAGMRERVEAVGGKFILESSPGYGTTIEVNTPNTSQRSKEEQML